MCFATFGIGYSTYDQSETQFKRGNGKASLAETLFQKLFGKRYFLALSGKSRISQEIPGNSGKSRDFPEIPGNPESEQILAKIWSLFVSGEVIFWPETGSRYRKVLRNRKKWHFRIRAPIDHFLRGKCDKCPPRVRRVKSGFPKNGHASSRFLDIFRLCTPLYGAKSAIKGRAEPSKITKNRHFFTFFQFFVIF